MRPRKNLKTLLRAFATVRKEYGQPISLVIVNGLVQDAPAPDLLQTWPDELGPLAVAPGRRVQCASNVTITGPIDTDELVGFYSLSEMVVYPSLAEGFGLPPLEAMACGAPVVASNATALPEVLGDAAMLIDPLDYHGFSRAMLRILRESDLALDLRAKGAAHARRYSAERAAMETMDVYAKTMATPARGALRQHASDRCR